MNPTPQGTPGPPQSLDAELEQIVDRHGLYEMMQSLQRICCDKAGHLASNWQDVEASKHWERGCKVFETAHERLKKIQMP